MSSESAAPAHELKMETEMMGPNRIVVRCSGRMVSDATPRLQSTVRPLIAENQVVVLDLSNVTFLDSSGLGALVGLWVSAKRTKCDLKLIHLTDKIKDLLRLSNLTSLEGDQPYFGM